jgi:hypothetical protein
VYVQITKLSSHHHLAKKKEEEECELQRKKRTTRTSIALFAQIISLFQDSEEVLMTLRFIFVFGSRRCRFAS